MDPIIKFDNVSFSYDELPTRQDGTVDDEAAKKIKYAVSNIDFTVNEGECVAILGHNGSGKSTIAKLCNGILVPDYGTVTTFGIDTKDEDRLLELRQKVGMVFQNPDNQIVATIVEEDVAFGPENLGVDPETIRSIVDECLKVVDMYEYRGYQPHKLSGGQKQRVAIAGILAMSPNCIIFDESTAMLDPRGRHEVMDVINKLHTELGKTVVFITHYMEEAITADRVVVMDHGAIIKDGTPLEVFSDIEGIRQVGLELPQAAELAFRLKNSGVDIGSDILSPADCVATVSGILGVEE